jgi:hypothetical protein
VRWTFLVAIASACGGGEPLPGDVSDAGMPTLADVQARVFTPSCAFSTCHSGSAPAAGLDLDLARRDAMVHVRSPVHADSILIVPGDPDASYLYRKLADDPPPLGDRMPIGSPLDPTRLALVRAWIAAGAIE